MTYRVHRHATAQAFLDRAEAWLMQAEAEHNLILGIARRLTESTDGYDPPIYLASVEDEDGVVGCAYRTPPYKFGLTRMPEEALPLLVDDAAEVYASLPAALGPIPETRRFAEHWSRKKGVRAREGIRQRIYQLEEVSPPARQSPGRLRLAEANDTDRVTAWIDAFTDDTGVFGSHPREQAERFIAKQALYLWEDERPVSMAGWTGRTPNGVRIGAVYTPPKYRGRGYATACVAALSQRMLDTGLAFCFLYTDRSNPTSNSIYQRIGYRPVRDVTDYNFDDASDGA